MLRLAVRVGLADAEIVLAELVALSPSGVEEVSHGDEIEYAIYGAPGEIPSLPDLKAAAGGALVSVSTTEVEDGWEDRWREFHQPLVVDGLLRVRPPWESQGSELHDLVIDPGRAFGTGAHATTSLCLDLLLAEKKRGTLVDLGCGSGVIAILAARLGFEPVKAFDNDPLAVEATTENALINRVDLEVGLLDLRRDAVPTCDVLVANILAPVLRVLAERLPDPMPTTVILSGLLEAEASQTASQWAKSGFGEQTRRARDGWAALVLER